MAAVSASIACSIYVLAQAVGWSSPWLALTAAFCILGIMDLLRSLVAIRLPSMLDRPRAWEIRGTVYRQAGVIVFGQLLRNTPLRFLNRRVYLAATRGHLARLRAETCWAEAVHFWAAGFTLITIIATGVIGWWRSATALSVFLVAAHVYPMLHLRWVRIRIDRHRSAALTPGLDCHLTKSTD